MIIRLSKLTYKHARRIVVIVVGFSVLAVGVVLIVMPGPAFVVIPLGLAILATEFVWARKLLKRMKDTVTGLRNTVSPARTCSPPSRDANAQTCNSPQGTGIPPR